MIRPPDLRVREGLGAVREIPYSPMTERMVSRME
jgi:hypothetical protein